MKQAWDLSYLYLLGHLRRHVYAGAILVGLVLLALPSYVSAFSLGTNSFVRVSKDFGLTLIGFYGILMAILIGSTTVARDLQTRALYPLLVRPLSRGVYLCGHLLALALVLGMTLFGLALCLTLALGLKTGKVDFSVGWACYGVFLQSIIVGAVCILASLRCSPALAGTIGAATVLLGNLSGAFIRFFLVEDRGSAVSAALAKGLKGALPNLTLFSLKDPMVHQLPLPPGYLLSISYYGAIWLVIFLLLGNLIFRKVDL